MEPGLACWMTLSFLSRRGGKAAAAWILSKVKKNSPESPRERAESKRKRCQAFCEIPGGGFFF